MDIRDVFTWIYKNPEKLGELLKQHADNPDEFNQTAEEILDSSMLKVAIKSLKAIHGSGFAEGSKFLLEILLRCHALMAEQPASK